MGNTSNSGRIRECPICTSVIPDRQTTCDVCFSAACDSCGYTVVGASNRLRECPVCEHSFYYGGTQDHNKKNNHRKQDATILQGKVVPKQKGSQALPPPPQGWSCRRCTYANPAQRALCELCGCEKHVQIPRGTATRNDERSVPQQPPQNDEVTVEVIHARRVLVDDDGNEIPDPTPSPPPPRPQHATATAAAAAPVVSPAPPVYRPPPPPEPKVDPLLPLRETDSTRRSTQFSDTLAQIRANCRAARTRFIDPEFRGGGGVSIFDVAPNNSGGMSLGSGLVQSALSHLFGIGSNGAPSASPSAASAAGASAASFPFTLFSAQSDLPLPQDVQQGRLGDCWFLSVVIVLAATRPEALYSLFLTKSVDLECGVFALRLRRDGMERLVVVDGDLPRLPGSNQLRNAQAPNGVLWPAILEKAYAKLYGGYEAIEAGRPEDAFHDLTGWPCFRLQNGTGGGGGASPNPSTTPTAAAAAAAGTRMPSVLQQEEWDDPNTEMKIVSFLDSGCMVCASSGGNAHLDAHAKAKGLTLNHAYAIVESFLQPHGKQQSLRMFRLRDPWGRGQHGWLSWAHGATEGTVLLTFAELTNMFNSVIVCVARPFRAQLELPLISVRSSPPRAPTPATAFIPSRDVLRDDCSFFVDLSCEVYIVVTQPREIRMSQFLKDITVLLVKHSDPSSSGSSGGSGSAVPGAPSAVHQEVVAAVRSNPYHVTSLTAMLDPGRYSVIPLSLQLTRPLHIEILSEAPASAIRRSCIQHGFTTRELLVMMMRDQRRSTRLAHTIASTSSNTEYYFDGMLQMMEVSYGFLRFLLAKHHGPRNVATTPAVSIETKMQSEGMTVTAAPAVVIPPGCTAVIAIGVMREGESRMLWSFQYVCRTIPKLEAAKALSTMQSGEMFMPFPSLE